MTTVNTSFPVDGGDPVFVNANGAANFSAGLGFINQPSSGVTGTWSSTEVKDALLCSSAPAGTWGSTEAKDTFAGTGHPSLFGSWASTEAKDVFSAAGHPPALPPVLVTSGTLTHTSFGTSIAPALPGSRVNGNIIIAMVEVTKAVTWPGDWTVIDSYLNGNIGSSYAYRVVDGTETAPNVTWTGNAEALGKTWQFSGVVTVGAKDQVGDAGNVATFSNPGIATTGDNSLVVLLWMGNNGTISGTPTGWTAQTSDSNTATIAMMTEVVATRGGSSTAISGQALSGSMRSLSFEVELTSVIPPNFAAWASTEAKDVWASRGSLIGGSWHSTEAKDLFAGAGFTPNFAVLSATEAKDTANFSVFSPPRGTLGATEAQDIMGFSGQPTPPLSLDVQATGGAHGSSSVGVTSATVSLTTHFTNDVLVMAIHTGGFWHQGAVTSITDTSGGFWQRRVTRQVLANHLNGTGDSYLEEWWAVKATAGAVTITINTDPTGAIVADCLAIAGANHVTPFDTHTGSGWLVDNYTGNVIDPGGLGHFGNPNAFVYTDAQKVFTVAWGASPDVKSDTTIPAGYTFLSREEQDEGSGNTLFLSSMAKRTFTQQFGTQDTWFGPDGTHISNRYLLLDNIVASDETGTDDVIRWFFDGTGQRTIEQFGAGQNSTTMNVVTYREHDILVCAVLIQSNLGTRVLSISDSNNNSGWQRRSLVTDNSTAISLEVWWVESPLPVSGPLTITTDSNTSVGDTVGAIAFAVNGADAFLRGEIWDQNGTLPEVNHGNALSGRPTIGPFDTSNDNVLVLNFSANVDASLNDSSLPKKFELPYLFLPTPATLESDGPPSYNIGLEYKFSGPVVSGGHAEFDVSPPPQAWLMIADAMPVGPVSPPHGSLAANEFRDRTTHNGDFTAIGIASPGGWVGFPPNSAAMATTDAKDKATNTGAFTAIWRADEGWIGYIPAFMSAHPTEHDDTDHIEGWKLGAESILGRTDLIEAGDRFAGGNQPAVSGPMHTTEAKDRFAGMGLIIPTGTPVPARKRRILITS